MLYIAQHMLRIFIASQGKKTGRKKYNFRGKKFANE